jgi:hypothetical protein
VVGLVNSIFHVMNWSQISIGSVDISLSSNFGKKGYGYLFFITI